MLKTILFVTNLICEKLLYISNPRIGTFSCKNHEHLIFNLRLMRVICGIFHNILQRYLCNRTLIFNLQDH